MDEIRKELEDALSCFMEGLVNRREVIFNFTCITLDPDLLDEYTGKVNEALQKTQSYPLRC